MKAALNPTPPKAQTLTSLSAVENIPIRQMSRHAREFIDGGNFGSGSNRAPGPPSNGADLAIGAPLATV